MLSSIKFYNWAQLSPQRIRLRSIIKMFFSFALQKSLLV